MIQEYLYRYISFETFVGMVQKKALTFVTPDKWEDPKEAAPFYKLLGTIEDKYLKILLALIYQKTYCQCWTKAVESDALWRIYAYGNRAIQIKVREKNLQLLPDVNIMQVEYLDQIKLEDASGHIESFLRSLAIKRRAFQHEEEVRLIKHYRFEDTNDAEKQIKAFLAINDHPQMVEIIDSLYPDLSPEEQVQNISHLLNIGKNKVETLDISFEGIAGFIGGVKVHPLAPSWYVNIVKEYCTINSVPFEGQSTLYSDE